jgi:putative phage-type endonuclease
LGLSPFKSAIAVYAEKIGAGDDDEASEAMRWGRVLEPLVIKAFQEETTRDVIRGGDLLRSSRWPWMICTLDATQFAFAEHEQDGPGDLEVKCTGWRMAEWTSGCPKHVWVQIQHQMAVTGHKWASVAALLGGVRFVWQDIPRDEGFITGTLVPELRDFWTRVESRNPVSPDGSESSAAALRALFPQDSGEIVALPGWVIDLDNRREALLAERKVREAEIKEISNKIKAEIGLASVGLVANGARYSLRLEHRSGHHVDAYDTRILRRSAKGKVENVDAPKSDEVSGV